MDFVEDDRIPVQEIIDKIIPPEIPKTEERKTLSLNSVPYQIKPPDPRSNIFKKKLTF
jgi:hypothetical protein